MKHILFSGCALIFSLNCYAANGQQVREPPQLNQERWGEPPLNRTPYAPNPRNLYETGGIDIDPGSPVLIVPEGGASFTEYPSED